MRFKGGIHPKDKKEGVEHLPIENFPDSKYFYIPLLQNIGSELEPLVEKDSYVKMWQKLGDNSKGMSVPIHSPVSGKVIKIGLLNGVKALIIENDFKYEKVSLNPIENFKTESKEKLINHIREMGIVGLGGATFPTHIKYNSSIPIETLIINACECEPYLNNDNRIMQENPLEIIKGIEIVLFITGAKKAIITIEDNKPKAIEIMKNNIKDYPEIEIKTLKTIYPQGGEKQLIKTVLGKELPSRTLPSSIGVLVSNVQTVAAVYEAIIKGVPLTERIITVTGKGVETPKNLKVKIGTPFADVLKFCDFNNDKTKKLISGGPLMGASQDSNEHPVVKGTTGLLALTEEELRRETNEPCISCGKCIDVCPMKLMPLMFERNLFSENLEKNREYNLLDCIDCGCCTYICPSNRPLNEAIKEGKNYLRTH